MSDSINRKDWLQQVVPVTGGRPATGRLLTFLCVLLAGAIASWAVFHFVHKETRSQNQLQFEQQGIQTAAEFESGLIHRDIKPVNIFICKHALEHDFAKVLDFGLVNTTSPAQSAEITLTGTLLGTPAYMAPEMIRSEPVDHRADIYSLGCVAHWLLTAAPVFSQTGATAIIASHLTDPVMSLQTRTDNDIPLKLDELIQRCLAKDPADRPQSARELETELATCVKRTWTQTEAHACWQAQKQLDIANGPTQLSSIDETILIDQ